MRALLLALMFSASVALPAYTQEAKEAAEKAETMVKRGVDKVQATGAAVAKDAKEAVAAGASAVADVKAKGEAVVQAEPLNVLKASLPTHLHNKLVHFPLALGIFGILFYLMSARWTSYLWPSRVLLATALVTAFASMVTGWGQRDGVQGTSLVETLEWHMHMGQISTALLALSLLLTFFPSARKWSWVILVAGVAALLITGALGGAVAA